MSHLLSMEREGSNEGEPISDKEKVTRFKGIFHALTSQNMSEVHLVDSYWDLISENPQTLQYGLSALLSDMSSGGDSRAKGTLQRIVLSKVPPLLMATRDREDRYNFAYAAASVGLVAFTPANPLLAYNSTEADQYLKPIFDCLRPEERLLLLNQIYKYQAITVSFGFMRVPYVTHREVLDRIKGLRDDPTFDAQGLKLAVVAQKTTINLENAKLAQLDVSEVGINYLEAFLAHFKDNPKEGLALISEAMTSGFTYTLERLIGLTVGRESLNGSEGKNFLPILKAVIAEAIEEVETGIPGVATQSIRELIDSSYVQKKSSDLAGNPLLAYIGISQAFSDEERFLISRAFLLSLEGFGYRFNDLTNQQIINIALGRHIVWAGDPIVHGNPIILKNHEGETLEVIGHIELKKPEPPATNGHVEVASIEVVEIDPAPVEVVEILNDEERALRILRGIFPEELSSEELDVLDREAQRFWADLDPKNPEFKRVRSFGPLGFNFKFVAGRIIKAPDDFFPQVELRRIKENDRSSDIGGMIRLAEDLAYPFFIDNTGGFASPLVSILDGDQDPYDLYWQVNHELLTLTHTRLVGADGQMDARIQAAVEHAASEIMIDGDQKKGASQEKIATQLARSRPYLIEVVPEGGSGVVRRMEIDRDRVYIELRPGDSRRVFQPLSDEDIREGQRRKGSAKAHASSGTVVFLPQSHNPRRIAIQNARENNVALVKVTEFYMNPEDGTISEVVIRTTFRSASFAGEATL